MATNRVRNSLARLAIVLLVTTGFLPAGLADASTIVSVGTPTGTEPVYQPFMLGGWALDTAATQDTGISSIHVWAYPEPGSGLPPIFLGEGSPVARPDVAAIFGSQFYNAGFSLTVRGLAPKTYQLAISAYSAVTQTWSAATTVTVDIRANPQISVDVPVGGTTVVQPFDVGGWAVDLAAASGTGVDTVHVWAFPVSGGSPAFVGATTEAGNYYGALRTDVGAAFAATPGSSQFTPSGWNVLAHGLPPGEYDIAAYPFSVLAGGFLISQSRRVTIAPTASAPTIRTAAGTYTGSITVEITVPTGTTVRVTRNGSTPTEASELYPTGGLSLSANTLLRARAFRSGWTASATASADYAIALVSPVILTPAGEFTAPVFVEINGPVGAQIRIARDGTTPSAASELYAGSFQISANTLLRAQAYKGGNEPSSVVAANYSFAAPMPTILTPGGAYVAPTPVTISIPAGSIVRVSRDGSIPSESSELYPETGLYISENTSLRARAFRSGWAASATASAEYSIALASPTLLTAGAVFSAPVSVEIGGPIGAQIRFTRDGSTPTPTCEQYVGPLQIDSDTMLRAQAFKNGNAPSAVVAADYTFQTATPAILTPAGTYTAPPTVQVSVPPASTVRLTRDESIPTETSELYAEPGVLISVNTSLRVRAFRHGWIPSAVVAAEYTITSLDGPVTITPKISPTPNSAGWNNSDVTVTFVCINALICPAPVVVAQETASQLVSGTASNNDYTATASVTIKLDKTGPVVALSSPVDGAVSQSPVAAVAGTASDALSGLAAVRCNGAAAAVNATVQCSVLLTPGRNAVVLSAIDIAGNSASAGARVTRTGQTASLTITPAVRTMVAGEVRSLVAINGYGQPAAGVAWTSSDPSVGAVDSTNGVLRVTGTGHATITASLAELSAVLDLTVLAGGPHGELPVGATRWRVATSSPDSIIPLILPANQVSEESPEFFVAEHNQSNGTNLIRALDADGVQLWSESSPGDWRFSGVGFADAFGGLVVTTSGGATGAVGLSRFGGPSSTMPWRYESAASALGWVSQAADGTIFAAELTFRSGDQDAAIVAIDGSTGQLKFRVPLPAAGEVRQDDGTLVQYVPTGIGRIAIGADGNAYVQTKTYNATLHVSPDPPSRRVESSIKLLTIRPDGMTAWRVLQQHVGESTGSNAAGDVWLGQTIADPTGNVLSSFTHDPVDGPSTNYIVRVTGDAATQYEIGNDFYAGNGPYNRYVILTGEDGTTVLWSQASLAMVDGVTGVEKWHVAVDPLSASLYPLAVRPDGGAVAVHYEELSSTLKYFDGSGQLIHSQPLPFNNSVWPLSVEDDALLGVDDEGFLNKLIINSFDDRTFAPSRSGQNKPEAPVIVTYSPEDQLGVSAAPYPSSQLRSELLQNPNRAHIQTKTSIVGQATLFPFLDDVGHFSSAGFLGAVNSRADVVAFIGHSVVQTDPNRGSFSVGLQFKDKDLIKQQGDPNCLFPALLCSDQQWVNLRRDEPLHRPEVAMEYAYWIPKLQSSAKVVFIASCYLSTEFQSLWSIDQGTTDRVLIVPAVETGTARLAFAAKAWVAFVTEISRRNGNVDSALAKANAACPECKPDERTQFKKVGGAGATPIRIVR